MEQILKLLKSMREDMKANQAKAEADRKAWREKIAARTEATKARTKAMRENMGNSHKEMVAVIKPEMDSETMACRETTEERLDEEKPTSPDRNPEAAEENKVPKEETVVQPVKRRKRRYRGKKKNCRAMRGAKGTDPRRLWIPDEFGCRLQEVLH
jgi:hypothetical protein